MSGPRSSRRLSFDAVGVASILACFALISDDSTFAIVTALALLIVARRWLRSATTGIAIVALGLLAIEQLAAHTSVGERVSIDAADGKLAIKTMYLAIAALLIGYIGEKAGARQARSSRTTETPAPTSLRRVRARARSHERARIARELHDGIVQTLSAAELRMDVIRRQVAAAAPQQAAALLRIQETVKDEVKDLRLLTRNMQAPSSSSIAESLTRIIERFRREAAITVTFVCEDADVPLRRAARHEIERIVQEALVNVRKHSGARCVAIHAGLRHGRWTVSIEDDGRGFPFAGHWTHWQLDRAQQGPFVIKQRARTMGATVSLDSTPGKGARLELEVPLRP